MNKLRMLLEVTLEVLEGQSSDPLCLSDLLKSALAMALLRHDLDPLRPIWEALCNNPPDQKALGNLTDTCSLLCTGELLFPDLKADYETVLGMIAPAYEQVHPEPGLKDPYFYERMLDLAIALELRAEGREKAAPWRSRRLQAPARFSYTTLLGLLASGPGFSDSLVKAEAVHMAYQGTYAFEPALVMSLCFQAREQNISLLKLIQGGIQPIELEISGEQMQHSESDSADSPQQVQRSDHAWYLHEKDNTIEIRVVTLGLGKSLHAVAGWAVAPLIYELPELIKELYDRRIELTAVKGARSRKLIESALGEGGALIAVSELHNATISPLDQTALKKRFDICVEWIHTCYPEISCPMTLEFRHI